MANTVDEITIWQNPAETIKLITPVAALLIATVSAIVAFKNYRDGKNRKKVEKSLELAKYYAEEILPEAFFIKKFIEIVDPIGEYKRTVERVPSKSFTDKELNELCGSGIKKKLWDEVKPEEILNAKIQCCSKIEEILEINRLDRQCVAELDEGTYQKAIVADYQQKCKKIANQLEAFAMNFTRNTADESVVYHSLHQTYLNLVEWLYFLISKANLDEKDRYYTSTTELYTLWKKRYEEHKRIDRRIEEKKKNRLKHRTPIS